MSTAAKPRLVYLSGEPGVGKSTLMATVTDQWVRQPLPPAADAPARDALTNHRTGRVEAVELGRRRDAFSGTDALPQTAINVACLYLLHGRARAETDLLLAEGARLANQRFLRTAADAGWDVALIHLHGEELAAHRRKLRADALGKPEQNPSWVKGRRTAAANLFDAAPSWGVRVIPVAADRYAGDPGYALATRDTILRGPSTPR